MHTIVRYYTADIRRFVKRKKMTTNVNKRVNYEQNFKKGQQTLIINIKFFFQMVCKLFWSLFAVRANSKFQFVRAAISIYSQTVTAKKGYRKPKCKFFCKFPRL